MSAYPPKADINDYGAGCPLMTQSGHWLIGRVSRFYFTVRRVGLSISNEALGFGGAERGPFEGIVGRDSI